MQMSRVIAVVVLGMVVCLAHEGFANGYRILGVKSVRANAMGEAFTAQADDPSAIAFNPSGIAQLEGDQVNVNITLCDGYTEHTAPDGTKTDNVEGWQTIPSLFVTSDLGSGKPVLGLGLSVPNGLSSEWEDDSFARYVATYSELFVLDVSPTVATRVGDRLMLGVSANYYYSEAKLNRMVDVGAVLGAPGTMDMESKLTGDGSAWGFNLGATYDISDSHRVALMYHHPYTIDYEGELEVGGAAGDVEASIDFPMTVVLAYAFRPTEKLTLEVDLDWTDWDSTDDIEIRPAAAGMSDTALEQNLNSTMAYKVGVQYLWTESVALRCGYIYNESATPEASWRPSLPDSDTHFLTGGFGYTWDNLTVDTAVQIIFYEDRTIDNNVDANESVSSSSVDGEYSTWAPCLSLGATYRF
jgi:long-chain fatty acid transport protein